ncbi:MAG: hypothetical protein H0U77_10475 [Nocardioidaceae bacterium]|nr:hypothetical protein [Nocardioidaceae bacterium]
MIKREKANSPRGRAWINGELDSETWFREVREKAREDARREVAEQLKRPRRARPATP